MLYFFSDRQSCIKPTSKRYRERCRRRNESVTELDSFNDLDT
jgi:hypothetical protein